jgi:hypothetical protein
MLMYSDVQNWSLKITTDTYIEIQNRARNSNPSVFSFVNKNVEYLEI